MLRLLDLFCCAGGAGEGYRRAGFEVVGCDIEPQPHNPHECYQDDALVVLDILLSGGMWHGYRLEDFAAIHASPVCKSYTYCNLSPHEKYQKQIADVRVRLRATKKPYVIENVMGAKRFMQANLLLCGSMFSLPMQRHRLFEIAGIDTPLAPASCNHEKATINVYGHSVWDSSKPGTPRKDGRKRSDSVPVHVGHEAMQIDWMSKEELAQAIPPPYTEWIGKQILASIS